MPLIYDPKHSTPWFRVLTNHKSSRFVDRLFYCTLLSMNNLLRSWRKPYGILLIAALLVSIVSFVPDGAIDIHLHDTYFIIATAHVYRAVALLLLFFAFLYRILRYLLYLDLLSWLHILVTLLGCALVLLPMHYEGFAGQPRRYYDYSAWASFKQFEQLNRVISVVAISWILAQAVFLLHILLGLLRLFRRRR